MSSGVTRLITGAFKGAGSADVDIETIGFRPRRVELVSEDDLASAVHQDSMADGEMIKTITAGTMSKVTTTGITLLDKGFRLGQDANMNVDGDLVHYVAYE